MIKLSFFFGTILVVDLARVACVELPVDLLAPENSMVEMFNIDYILKPELKILYLKMEFIILD